MKRLGCLFGGLIPMAVLLAASSVAAVEIAPLPHRAIDRIEEGVPAEPPATDGNGQELPPPSVDGGGTAPGAQGTPPSQGGAPPIVSAPLPPPAPAAGVVEPVVRRRLPRR